MEENITSCAPVHVSGNKHLWDELRKQGEKATKKRLSKAKNFPRNGTTTERSKWWMQLKEGKKKAKLAMVITASEYVQVLHQLSALQTKTNSQKEEIGSLKQKLSQQEDEIRTLEDLSKRQKDDLDLMSKRYIERENTLQQENTSLRQQLNEIKKQKQTLRLELILFQELCQRSVVPSGLHFTHPLAVLDLLKDVPNLQRNHTNYEFWKKLRELAVMGLDLYFLFSLVQAKCPSKVWQAVTEFKENNWLNINHSDHANIKTRLEEFRRCVSKVLGSVHYTLYFNRYQRPGESFEDYVKEKFKLYCSYGDFKQKPDKNDELFLLTVIQTVNKKYERMNSCSPSSYGDMIVIAKTIDEELKAERGSTCENCDRKGHRMANCRRPGGGAEVENDECYTCGMPGHFSRNCPKWH